MSQISYNSIRFQYKLQILKSSCPKAFYFKTDLTIIFDAKAINERFSFNFLSKLVFGKINRFYEYRLTAKTVGLSSILNILESMAAEYNSAWGDNMIK